MSVTTVKKTGNIEIRLTAHHNCDDAQLFWRTKVDGTLDGAIPGSLGFMIERQRKTREGSWGETEVLRNRVGFSAARTDIGNSGTGDPTRSSNVWPFQCYEWTDHGANNGETVRYRVTAVRLPVGGLAGTTVLDPIADSDWTEAIAVEADCGGGFSAYFNRGFVMSQFVARMARQNGWTPRDIKAKIKELEEPLRRFLSGELRVALLRLLDEVIEDPGLSLYAALYELSDEELIKRLELLHGRAHVVLTNGSDKKGDGNKDSRKTLNQDDPPVDVHDRLLGSKGLGHNKFAIVVRTSGKKPLKVWTGSTNWAPTGLCTQVNNGILIENEEISKIYLDEWQRLADAQNNFPEELVSANAESPRTSGNTDVWFTRVRNPSKKNTGMGSDLQALVDLVNGAKEVILYVMFQPGVEPLASILKRASNLYVRGVVSTVQTSSEEQFALMGIDKNSKNYHTALVQPEGIVKDFSAWVKEVTRAQFLYPPQSPGIGHAITHSKIIVIDPFREDCKVITGSHNFSKSASENNDDNFVVIHGNKDLAEAYAVACQATYSHYRWRVYVKDQTDAGKDVWDHLSDKPEWQGKYLTAERKKHLSVWCKQPQTP